MKPDLMEMKPDYWDKAKRSLARKDPVMAAIIKRHPRVFMVRRGEAFMTLARAICGQQISVKAAQSVWNRVCECVGDITPQNVLSRKRQQLRACGLSDRKVEYIADLAQHFADGKIHERNWPEMGDAGVGGVCLSQDAPSGWLICQNLNHNFVSIDESDNATIGLLVSIDPASGVVMPEQGQWVELTVHLDDPAAQSCDEDIDDTETEGRSAEQIVLFCRGQMVVESVTAVDGP